MHNVGDRIPVTVLTGFLGSGKTTLLNKILQENHGKKIAVIENEFGEVGVDNELVIGADEEIFEMNNGCICCTVRGDLIRILGQLMKRKDKFDYILVETTGLANPAPVAQTFWVDDEMKEQLELDAIITVVDAKHVWQHIDESPECQEQIAFADVILLNKTDLVSENELKELEKKLLGINTQAKIYRTNYGDIEMEKILNVKAFNLDAKIEINPGILKEEVPFEWAGLYELNEFEYSLYLDEGPDPSIDIAILKSDISLHESIEQLKKKAIRVFSEKPSAIKPGKFLKTNESLNQLNLGDGASIFRLKANKKGSYVLFAQHHPYEFDMKLKQKDSYISPQSFLNFEHSHEHDSTVTSIGIDEEGELDLKKLDKWLSFLLQEKGPDIYRMKGILNIKENNDRFVFQGVHMLFDAKADRKWKDNERRRNQAVFIGKNLDREEILKGFRGCMAKTVA